MKRVLAIGLIPFVWGIVNSASAGDSPSISFIEHMQRARPRTIHERVALNEQLRTIILGRFISTAPGPNAVLVATLHNKPATGPANTAARNQASAEWTVRHNAMLSQVQVTLRRNDEGDRRIRISSAHTDCPGCASDIGRHRFEVEYIRTVRTDGNPRQWIATAEFGTDEEENIRLNVVDPDVEPHPVMRRLVTVQGFTEKLGPHANWQMLNLSTPDRQALRHLLHQESGRWTSGFGALDHALDLAGVL